MKSPADMKIIQIEITNACPHGCSNCTRFNGHHRKPFMMDWDTFKLAVDSLKDFPGMVGIMGGEPTLHPEFERFSRYLRQARFRPGAVSAAHVGDPIRADEFCEYRNRHWAQVEGQPRGLWSSLGLAYARNFEVIRDVYGYQCLNDHSHAGEHQALMITRRELGITDAEWPALRDECWIQNLWSASITPKGAFFCEVAAAMDMLTGGPGGWPIEKGWWGRTPAEFGGQLAWCELCSGCLAVPRRRATDGTDDVSPAWEARLKELGSRKLAAGKVAVLDAAKYDRALYKRNVTECEPYLPAAEGNTARVVPATVEPLRVRKVQAVLVCVGYSDFLSETLFRNVKEVDRLVVVTSSHDKPTQEMAQKHGATLVVSDRFQEAGPFNKGKMINDGVAACDADGWILITDADIILPAGLRDMLTELVLNPGCLYYAERRGPKLAERQKWLAEFKADPGAATRLKMEDPTTNRMPWGYFQLFSPLASALRDDTWPHLYSEKFGTAGGVDNHFQRKFPAPKRVWLPGVVCVHIPHGDLGANWSGRVTDAIKGPGILNSPAALVSAGPAWIPLGFVNGRRGFVQKKRWPRAGYLKLIRVDTGDCCVTRFGPDVSAPGWVNDGRSFHAYHIGVYASRHRVEVTRANRGRIVVKRRKIDATEFTGWGMGHVMFEDNRQAWVWDGQEIEPTDFEVWVWPNPDPETLPDPDRLSWRLTEDGLQSEIDVLPAVTGPDLVESATAVAVAAAVPATVLAAAEAPRIEPVVSTVEPAPVPVLAGAARRGMAIVVCSVRLPAEAWAAWLARNAEVVEELKQEVYLVTDLDPDRAPWVQVIQPPAMDQYSPARASNAGIRAAYAAGFGVIIKTDIDCILSDRFILDAEKLVPQTAGEVLAPYYMMAAGVTFEQIRDAKKWQQGCGTVAARAEDWARLKGYDERQYGYGFEDGDLVIRARFLGMKVKRRASQVVHVHHEPRTDATWYPMRRDENKAAAKVAWHDAAESGTWGQ